MSFLLAHTALLGRSAARPAASAAATASSLGRRGVKTADAGKEVSPESNRPKGYDEQGASADDVAETNAAFEPGSGPKDAAKKVESESGQGMQDSAASRTASDPAGEAAEPKK